MNKLFKKKPRQRSGRFRSFLLVLFSAWLVQMATPSSAVAGNSATKYDQSYDRPTHFPTFSQPTTWAATMSYFVYVRDVNGNKLSNYEVAVYDQDGSLRHVGRSIQEQGELCTLTIPGQSGHTFTFKVIYGDFEDPTIVDASESIPFKANAVVGGPANPFWLTIPALPITGDVNGDGKVSISDMTALVSLLLQRPATIPQGADVNGDTKLNLQDVTALKEILLSNNNQ